MCWPLRPDRDEANFYTDREFRPHRMAALRGNVRGVASRIHVTGSAVREDDIYSTQVSVVDEQGVLLFCGFIHDRSILKEPPASVQEAVILHAPRVLREWIAGQDQTLLHYVNIQAGDEMEHFQLDTWFRTGRCVRQSPGQQVLFVIYKICPPTASRRHLAETFSSPGAVWGKLAASVSPGTIDHLSWPRRASTCNCYSPTTSGLERTSTTHENGNERTSDGATATR